MDGKSAGIVSVQKQGLNRAAEWHCFASSLRLTRLPTGKNGKLLKFNILKEPPGVRTGMVSPLCHFLCMNSVVFKATQHILITLFRFEPLGIFAFRFKQSKHMSALCSADRTCAFTMLTKPSKFPIAL